MLHCSETISSLSTLKVSPLVLPALLEGLAELLALDDGLLLLGEEALELEDGLIVPCTLTSCPTCFEKSSEPANVTSLPFFSCSMKVPFWPDWMQPWSVFSPFIWLELLVAEL
jgi:hypothetical protein